MNRDQIRRVAAIEQGRSEVPADIRAWLGEPVTAEELARCAQQPARCDDVVLPRDFQRWLDERPTEQREAMA